MKFIIVGCLILLIPFLLFFPIVSKLIQFQVWKLTTNLVAKLGSIQNEDSRLIMLFMMIKTIMRYPLYFYMVV